MGIFGFYGRMVHRAPFMTKAAGTGVTYALSDMTAQGLEYRLAVGKERDKQVAMSVQERALRTLKFSAVGAALVGPGLSVWFNVMDHFVPGRSLVPVTKKLFLDQVIQGPIMIAAMYTACAGLNGKSLAQIKKKLDESLWETWVNSVYVWGPIQILQQTVVPMHYRVALANLVSYFWDTYLSYMMMTDSQTLGEEIMDALETVVDEITEELPLAATGTGLLPRRKTNLVLRRTSWRIIDTDDDDPDGDGDENSDDDEDDDADRRS